MSRCDKCGHTLWYDGGFGKLPTAYCRKCDPPEVKILPPELVGSFDIEEESILLNPCNDILLTDPLQIGGGVTATSLEQDGGSIRTYDELPENGEEGEVAFIKGTNSAHVWDGEEWHNLGSALRQIKKKSIDAKCDRRAAVAATKAKNDE